MEKSPRKILPGLWPYLVLVCATLVLLCPVIFTREASFCIKSDNRQQAYPWFAKLATSLHKGYLPVWDANIEGGRSLVGELQPGIFYPLNIIWCWFFGSAEGIDVYYLDLLVSLHYLICALGMYRLGRLFRLPPVPAIATSLIFTFTSSLSARSSGQTCIFFGLSLLPWTVYFASKYYLQKHLKKHLMFAGLLGGLGILAGHVEPFFHSMLIIGILIIVFEYRDRKKWNKVALPALVSLSFIVFFAVLISLPQDYYAIQYLQRSYRNIGGMHFLPMGVKLPLNVYLGGYIIRPENLANLFARDLSWPIDDNIIYMGILPLFLLIGYCIKRKSIKLSPEHAGLSRVLGILLGIGILCVVGQFTFFAVIIYYIPLVNTVRELGRYLVLISFSASLMVGLAITYLDELKNLFRPPSTIQFYAMLALIANTLYLIIVQPADLPLDVLIPFLLCFGFLLITTQWKTTLYLGQLALAVIFIDLLCNPVSYLTTNTIYYPTHFYARDGIFDKLTKTYGTYRVAFNMNDPDMERRNLGDVYPIQSTDGQGATMNNAFFDFTHSSHGSYAEMQDLLNIRYVLSDHLLDSNFSFVDSVHHLNLYERKNYYPRTYWKHQLGKPGREIETENDASIHQIAYSDEYQKVDVECSSPDSLIFSENAYPGWKCYDNQKEIPIYQAAIKNFPPLFRCIALDKGHHVIEFKYNKVFHWF